VRSDATRAAGVRIGALRALLLLFFAVLAARAAHLTVVDTRRGEAHATRQLHATLPLPPARGLIVDREGSELAVTVRSPSVYVIPALAEERVAGSLARLLHLPERDLRERLRGRERFTFVSRWVSPAVARAVREKDLPGVGLVSESRRAYPGKELAAQVLGFANIDGRGVRGVEQQEDDWLRGSAQAAPVERDGSGRLLAEVVVQPAETSGGDVMLTLDARMQAEAELALHESVAESGARGGWVVSVDPHSGEILALAEDPPFDPNRFREFDYRATRSRVFLDALEPGSTLKVFLAAAALEAGAVGPHELFDVSEGKIRVPGKWIHDLHSSERLDLAGIVRVSSNVGAVLVAQRVGAERHFEALQRFGFGSPTGSGFPVESAGLLRPWRSWRPVDQATIAFGQGIAVTPIQLAAATAALANGGELLRPRLVKAHRRPGGSWDLTQPTSAGRAVSPATAAAVLRMMEAVVGPEGTGHLAGLRGVRVAGKTGTAQKLDPRTGAYSRDRFIAWFVGVVPADDPRLVMVAGLDEPRRGAHYGGASAAPLFARVAAAQLAYRGIMTEPEPIPAAVLTAEGNREEPPAVEPPVALRPEEPEAAPRRRAEPPAPAGALASAEVAFGDDDRVLLPDFHGLAPKVVARIAAESHLELQVQGSGRAVFQDPQPGTILGGSDRRVFVRFGEGNAAPAAGAVSRMGEG
jgi:cell division protein FtsI (penicillin-binding protein 3)